MVGRILAIAWIRYRMGLHSMREGQGIVRAISSGLIVLIGGLFSLGMAVGFGVMAWFALRTDDPNAVLILYNVVFYACALFGLVMPLLFAASGHGFDLRRLLVFPVSRGQLFGISLGSALFGGEHVFYYPSLLAVTAISIVMPGAQVVLGLAIVLAVTASIVTWSHTIMLLLQGVMRRRRSRELVGFLVFLVIVLGSVVPALLVDSSSAEARDDSDLAALEQNRWVRLFRFLPPSVAASGLNALHDGQTLPGLLSLLGLGAWILPGALAGRYTFTRHVLGDGGSGGGSPSRRMPAGALVPARQGRFEITDLPFVSPEVLGVAAKEMRYLARSVVGKFNLVMSPVLALIVVFVFARNLPEEAVFGLDPETLALFGLLGYTALICNNFINNAFAWEGSGVKLYFFGPVPLDKILLGKNLGVWAFASLSGVLVLFTWSVFKSIPDAISLVSSLLAFACCVVVFTTVGNFVSILFPAARDPSSMTNSPSGVAILIGLLTLLVSAGAISVVVFAPVVLGHPALQPPIVGLLLASLLLAHRVSLPFAARLMGRRAESIVDTLRSA